MVALRDELTTEITSLRDEIRALYQHLADMERRLSAQLVDLKVTMERNHRSMLLWFVSTQIATITVVAILINSLRI